MEKNSDWAEYAKSSALKHLNFRKGQSAFSNH